MRALYSLSLVLAVSVTSCRPMERANSRAPILPECTAFVGSAEANSVQFRCRNLGGTYSQAAVRAQATDARGQSLRTTSTWSEDLLTVALKPGFTQVQNPVEVRLQVGDAAVGSSKLSEAQLTKAAFIAGTNPSLHGLHVEIGHVPVEDSLGLKLVPPERPHELYLVGWGGSDLDPHPPTAPYLLAIPANRYQPGTNAGQAYALLAASYPENAKAMRLRIIRLISQPATERLTFRVDPDDLFYRASDGESTRIPAEQNRDYVLSITAPVYKAKSEAPIGLYLSGLQDGHPAQILWDEATIRLLGPGSVMGHPVRLYSQVAVMTKRPKTPTTPINRNWIVRDRQKVEFTVLLSGRRFRIVAEEDVTLPLNYAKAPALDQWNTMPVAIRITKRGELVPEGGMLTWSDQATIE